MTTLSVIVPVYNERENVAPFYERTKPVLERLGLDWELVFVNDGSTDGTLEAIRALRERDPRVKALSLSRNFGYHPVLIAGLSSRESDLYAIVDVDGEDPPELLEAFLGEIRKGAQTAYGDRSHRDEPRWIIFWRWLFYRISRSIGDAPMRLWMGEFSMFTRRVRDAVLRSRSTFPFLRAELGYAGFKTVGVPYFRASRQRGASHYNFLSMTKFAVGGLMSSSTFPLRASLYLSAALAAGFLGWLVAARPGRLEAAGTAAVLTFFYLLATVPMLSLYLARTYKDGARRPVFIVDPESSFL